MRVIGTRWRVHLPILTYSGFCVILSCFEAMIAFQAGGIRPLYSHLVAIVTRHWAGWVARRLTTDNKSRDNPNSSAIFSEICLLG